MALGIYNEDCITGARKHFPDASVNLLICDPPFGLGESSFGNQYNRNGNHVIEGYTEAPEDYAQFSLGWLAEAKRVLKDNGSMYIVSGWNNLRHIENAIAELDLFVINKIIWKYSFGVYTKRKYVSSHYEILYVKKSKRVKVTFNPQPNGNSGDTKAQYRDLEDVWVINKDYRRGKAKNANKLPEALVEKMILHSSSLGYIVGDFFLGNFTTALVAKRLGRIPVGFEINKQAYDYFMPLVEYQAIRMKTSE